MTDHSSSCRGGWSSSTPHVTSCHPPASPHSTHAGESSDSHNAASSRTGPGTGSWLLMLVIVALLTFLVATGTAGAQAPDPCDTNPDSPECNVSVFDVQPADPATCPAGGWIFIYLGAPYPICNGLPGPPGPPAPATAPAAAAPPAPVTVIQQVINQPVIAPVQPAGCLSRRRFDVTIPERFRWGTRVKVIVGGERQYDQGVPATFVRQNHRIRVDLRARPCGVYAVIVTKTHLRPWVRLYTAGPNGNMTGLNLALARGAR